MPITAPPAQHDDEVLGRPGDRNLGRLVRYVEEFEGVGRNGQLKASIHRGDGADMTFGQAHLYVFDGFALLVDDASFHAHRLLLGPGQDGQQQQERRQQPVVPRSYPR